MLYGPYPGVVSSIHDGDTLTIDLDLGFGIHSVTNNCRLYGINAPELITQAGKDALAFIQTLVKPGDKVKVMSHGWDKYGGRYDGTVILADGSDLAAHMLSTGHAVAI